VLNQPPNKRVFGTLPAEGLASFDCDKLMNYTASTGDLWDDERYGDQFLGQSSGDLTSTGATH
jgi:hypothetical protein